MVWDEELEEYFQNLLMEIWKYSSSPSGFLVTEYSLVPSRMSME